MRAPQEPKTGDVGAETEKSVVESSPGGEVQQTWGRDDRHLSWHALYSKSRHVAGSVQKVCELRCGHLAADYCRGRHCVSIYLPTARFEV